MTFSPLEVKYTWSNYGRGRRKAKGRNPWLFQHWAVSLQPPRQLIGHQSKDFLLRRKEEPQPPVLSLGENTATSEVHYLWGEFSSKKWSWVAPFGRWDGNMGSVATHEKPYPKAGAPPLHSHWCTWPRRVRVCPKLKRSGKRVREKKGPLYHGGRPISA